MGSYTLSPLQFVKQVEQRVIRHRRAHLFLIFLPPLLASLVAGFFAPSLPLIPSLSFSPFFLLTALLGLSLALALGFAVRGVRGAEWAAHLIDEKIQGKERFLTLVTLPDSQLGSPLHPLLEQDAAQKANAFVPAHDVPFILDRKKVIASLLGSVLLLALAFFTPALLPSSSLLRGEEGTETLAAAAERLEQVASRLSQQETTPAGEEIRKRLLSLARDLRSPDLSPQEKRQRLAEARKELDLPLPDLLPFDLRLFSKKQEKEGVRQGEKPQGQGQLQAEREEDSGGQSQKLASAAGKPEQNRDGKEGQQEKPTPQPQGGGIQFDFPQEKVGREKPSGGPEKPGEGPADAQAQAQGGRGPGQDPNRPGGGQDQVQSPGPHPGEAGGAGKAGGIGSGPGERYYRPGEQPGGFLTKDARFVKVRVPRGVEPQGESGRRVPNAEKTAPLTPYSNAPLPPAGPPEQAQIKQPIPLEYRAILQK